MLGISAPLQVLFWLANIGVATVFFICQQASRLRSLPPGVNFTIRAIEDHYYGCYRIHCAASGPAYAPHSLWLMKPNTVGGSQYVSQSTSSMALRVAGWRARVGGPWSGCQLVRSVGNSVSWKSSHCWLLCLEIVYRRLFIVTSFDLSNGSNPPPQGTF